MKKIFLVFFALTLPCLASAEFFKVNPDLKKYYAIDAKWEEIKKADEYTFFLNKKNLSQKDNYRKSAALLNYNQPLKLKDGTPYLSVVIRYIYDCSASESANLAVVGYSDLFGQGNIVFHENNMNNLEFNSVRKNSQNEEVMRYICR